MDSTPSPQPSQPADDSFAPNDATPVKPLPDRNARRKKFLVIAGIAVLLIAIGSFLGYRLMQSDKDTAGNIVIGDTTITPENIAQMTNSINIYKEQNPDIQFAESPEEEALDVLVMNAGLKMEAKQYNKSLDEAGLQQLLGPDIPVGEYQNYRSEIENGATPVYYEFVNRENVALQNKLSDDLIGRKSLFYMSANFDSPYFRNQPSEADIEKLHETARSTMENEYLPMFKSGATNEEIASKATRNYTVNLPENSDPAPFLSQIVYTADYMKFYQQDLEPAQYMNLNTIQDSADIPQTFTDWENVDYGAPVKDLKNTSEEINKLQNVGDHTGVFASKTGAYMIIRLADKSGGVYPGWQDFLSSLKERFVKQDNKNAFQNQFQEGASLLADKLGQVSLPGEQSAEAQSGGCGAHNILVEIEMLDADSGQRVNGPVQIVQASGTCPGGSASGNGYASFQGNCWNSAPTWSSQLPSGYSRVGTQADEWTPANVNARGNFRVFIWVRRNQPPQVQVNGNSSMVNDGTGSLLGASGANNYSSPHQIGLGLDPGVPRYVSSIQASWKIDQGTTQQMCAVAPTTVTTQNGNLNLVGSNQQCSPVGGGNGLSRSFTFRYRPANAPNVSCTLSANPASISNGQSSTLSWTTSNATGASINQGIGTVPTSGGSRSVSPTSNTTYTMTVTGSGGATATCSATVTVGNQPPPQQAICQIYTTMTGSTGSGITMAPGNITIYWYLGGFGVTNARMEMEPDLRSSPSQFSGSKTVYVDSTTTYTATLYGNIGDTPIGQLATCSFTVTINDTCPNIPGQQMSVPPDHVLIGGNCYPATKKYMRIYGNDVSAGGGFGEICEASDPAASIKGYTASQAVGPDTAWLGASSQFGAFALGTINEFFTANMRGPTGATNLPRPPLDLTFGNTKNGTSKVNVNEGGSSGSINCITDYFSLRDQVQAGNQIGTTVVPRGVARALYYDNDVYISGSGISFADEGSWGPQVNSIPSFYLVVRGNIYIDPSVTRLDGVYIAQPRDDGTKGEIITCSNIVGVTPGLGGCDNKLTINGAFIARQVRFKRTAGNLAAAGSNEPSTSGQIAEVFNFSPEVYLSPLHPSLRRSQPMTKYDYITSLPPVL